MCAKNRLPFDPKKTKSIVLSREREVLYFLYNLRGSPVLRVPFINDLGTSIDSSLSFINNAPLTINTALRVLGMISRLCRQFSTPVCLLHLFKTLARSRLEFGSITWNSLTLSQAVAIENMQKRIIRIVYDRYKEIFFTIMERRLALHKFEAWRPYRGFTFLHKDVHGEDNLINLLHFFILSYFVKGQQECANFLPFLYVSVYPLSRVLLAFNKARLAVPSKVWR